MAKPRISASSFIWLERVAQHVAQYRPRGDALRQAASDVLDSWASKDDLRDLIRRRILTVVPLSGYDGHPLRELSGSTWTVEFTDRAVRALWPELATRSAANG